MMLGWSKKKAFTSYTLHDGEFRTSVTLDSVTLHTVPKHPIFVKKYFQSKTVFFYVPKYAQNSNILIFIENKFSDDNWDSGRVCIGNISIMQSTILSIFCHFSRGRPRGNISLFPENSQKYKSKILAIKRSHSENDDFRYFQASRISILESTLEFLWRSGRRVITNSVCSGFWWFMVCPLPSKIWGKNVRSSFAPHPFLVFLACISSTWFWQSRWGDFKGGNSTLLVTD